MKRPVYIGTEKPQELAAHVLRATIEARSGGNVEVHFLNRAMAAAGFRVLVPDQRGYNVSDKPKGVRPYNLDDLALDVIGLIGGAGREKACVVAHDWGGAVGWWLGMKFPDRVGRLGEIATRPPARGGEPERIAARALQPAPVRVGLGRPLGPARPPGAGSARCC